MKSGSVVSGDIRQQAPRGPDLITDIHDVPLLDGVINRITRRIGLKVGIDHSQSIMEMIADGKYNRVDKNITHENFPKKARYDSELVSIELLCFNRVMKSETVLEAMKIRNLSPIGLAELAALGKKFFYKQCRDPIVGLRDKWKYLVPNLCGWEEIGGFERRLLLHDFNIEWPPSCYFGAVIKVA